MLCDLPYSQDSKLTCHRFMETDKRQEILESDERVIGTAVFNMSACLCGSSEPQFPQDHVEGQRTPVHRCFTGEEPGPTTQYCPFASSKHGSKQQTNLLSPLLEQRDACSHSHLLITYLVAWVTNYRNLSLSGGACSLAHSTRTYRDAPEA